MLCTRGPHQAFALARPKVLCMLCTPGPHQAFALARLAARWLRWLRSGGLVAMTGGAGGCAADCTIWPRMARASGLQGGVAIQADGGKLWGWQSRHGARLPTATQRGLAWRHRVWACTCTCQHASMLTQRPPHLMHTPRPSLVQQVPAYTSPPRASDARARMPALPRSHPRPHSHPQPPHTVAPQLPTHHQG